MESKSKEGVCGGGGRIWLFASGARLIVCQKRIDDTALLLFVIVFKCRNTTTQYRRNGSSPYYSSGWLQMASIN